MALSMMESLELATLYRSKDCGNQYCVEPKTRFLHFWSRYSEAFFCCIPAVTWLTVRRRIQYFSPVIVDPILARHVDLSSVG
eukprot:9488742-Pyramimonas_sp.AAC.1